MEGAAVVAISGVDVVVVMAAVEDMEVAVAEVVSKFVKMHFSLILKIKGIVSF